MRNPELWKAIEAFALDDPAASNPFSAKLAATENWGEAHCANVIAEYRRFLYLTQVADFQVTPSFDVDRAWHLHLTYSRNYWDELCGKVLGQPLHHQPGTGPEEAEKFRVQYLRTLELYRMEFREDASARIWPTKRRAISGLQAVSIVVAVLALLGGIFFSEAFFALFVPAFATFVVTSVFSSRRGSTTVNTTGCGSTCGDGGCGGD